MLDRRTVIAALPLLGAAGLIDSIARVKPSVVGITTVDMTRMVAPQLKGTGFAVGDGTRIVTNHHVVDNSAAQTAYFVLSPTANGVTRRTARVLRTDPVHDLALLAIDGAPLPPVRLREDAALVPDGTEVAITGFPIGAVLGLVPATQRGIVAATTPNQSALPHSSLLDAAAIRAARFPVYQLDMVAYPGNSGSPLYRSEDGEVIGILNSGFVKTTKERVISDPSGVSFAIPATYIRALIAG